MLRDIIKTTIFALVIVVIPPLVAMPDPVFYTVWDGRLFAAEKATTEWSGNAVGAKRSGRNVPVAAKTTTPGQKYLGKDYIDSTIIRAIYIVSDAANVAGVGFRETEGIEEARRIARKLRLESKGDPNERYAQWKIQELEWLVKLEERDLALQKMKENEADVNRLIADYNGEVGKPRPDFKTLLRFHSRMTELNTNRANEMAKYIEKRSGIMARESIAAVERALMSNNEAIASSEFRYCLRNRPYLGFPANKFEEIENRVSACSRSRDELPVVRIEIDEAHALLDEGWMGDARSKIALANYRFSDIKNFIPERDAAAIYARLIRFNSKLNRAEDSLVAVNLHILKTQGVDAANRYLQTVLRVVGVCREKAAHVDQAILAVASPEKTSKMQREIEAVAKSNDGAGNDVLIDMRQKAMAKAQRKLDSLAALETIGFKSDNTRQAAAQQIIIAIYRMLEQNNIRDAVRRFDKEKDFLKSAVDKEVYDILATTVTQAYQAAQ